ncbi:hypothetical protein ACFX1X_021972 [Malus domestica]
MEEAKGGELKNILMAKFKEGTSESQIEQLIESFANLVNLVEPMKSFHWGKELSIEKEEEGYIHIFETTFESVEGMAEYAVHPAHHDFAKLFLPNLEKMCSIGYRLGFGSVLVYPQHHLLQSSLPSPDPDWYRLGEEVGASKKKVERGGDGAREEG